jgi:hypothetical protein
MRHPRDGLFEDLQFGAKEWKCEACSHGQCFPDRGFFLEYMYENTVQKNTVNGREGWRWAREKPTVRKALTVATGLC